MIWDLQIYRTFCVCLSSIWKNIILKSVPKLVLRSHNIVLRGWGVPGRPWSNSQICRHDIVFDLTTFFTPLLARQFSRAVATWSLCWKSKVAEIDDSCALSKKGFWNVFGRKQRLQKACGSKMLNSSKARVTPTATYLTDMCCPRAVV